MHQKTKYNILFVPDIHWGAIDPELQWKCLEFIFTFMEECLSNHIPIDLLVIAGDYFDSKLPLNSQEAIRAIQWFHRLYQLCWEHDIRIRIFQGTLEHDNDQLHVFDELTHPVDTNTHTGERDVDYAFFKIFTKTTSEETLPGLQCIYCPDETLQTDEYEEIYINEMLHVHDLGFFHGSFDVVYGSLLESNPSLIQKKNVIFSYEKWNKLIHGPLLAGHWHDGKQWEELYYGGSPIRYKFDENEEKGILFMSYEYDSKQYFVHKVKNPFACEYTTYELYSIACTGKESYMRLIEDVEAEYQRLQQPPYSYLKNKIRIVFYITDEKPENDVAISALRKQFINRKDIKIVIKNKLKAKRKQAEKQKIEKLENDYGFIYKGLSAPNVIEQFIRTEYDAEVPLEYIQKKTTEYIKEK